LIDRVRAAGHTVPLDGDDLASDAGAESEVETAEWREQRRETAAYVAGLAPALQQLVKLRFEDELSQEQTAAALGMYRRRGVAASRVRHQGRS
jgi:DNA-directed RNA polymerase specialized sigma24 family protein